MAWDFETDAEFEAELQWMRDFIDTQLIPLEPIYDWDTVAKLACLPAGWLQ